MARSSSGNPVDPADAPRRIDRRAMIKAAAIAGAGAWTAPVIIDSLSSPAAAASVPGQFYKFAVLGTDDGCFPIDFSPAFPPAANCTPANYNSAVNTTGLNVTTIGTCSRTQISVQLTHSSTCRITSGTANSSSTLACDSSTPSIVNTTTTSTASFSGLPNAGVTAYYFVITCS